MTTVRTEQHGRVLVVTIDRPDVRNAVDEPTAQLLAAALDRLDTAPELSVGVLTGAGGTFCAGRDLKAALTGDHPWVPGRGFAGMVEHPPAKPLIAAVEGHALGGGLEIVLACDLVVAGRSATLGLPEVRRGRIAGAGGLFRLPERVPYQAAMELALTGEPVGAERAALLGLVNHVVDDGGALDAALALAGRIAANGPLAVATTKQVMRDSRDWPAAECFARQEPVSAAIRASEDALEGARAFAEKRPPVWQGR